MKCFKICLNKIIAHHSDGIYREKNDFHFNNHVQVKIHLTKKLN